MYDKQRRRIIEFVLLSQLLRRAEKSKKSNDGDSAYASRSSVSYAAQACPANKPEFILAVSNLSHRTKASLKAYMEKFGTVSKVILPCAMINNKAFIFFNDGKYPLRLQHELDDNKIYVSLQASETFLNASRSIMLCKVGHAPEFAFDSHDVWIHFSQFGVITNLTPPNQNLGNDGYEFCFLKFLDYASASKALSASPHNFGSVWVVARKAKDF